MRQDITKRSQCVHRMRRDKGVGAKGRCYSCAGGNVWYVRACVCSEDVVAGRAGMHLTPLPAGVQGKCCAQVGDIQDALRRRRHENLAQYRGDRDSRLVEPSESVWGRRSGREESEFGGGWFVVVCRHLEDVGWGEMMMAIECRTFWIRSVKRVR
jgi:hypothetical protein